MKKFEVTVQKKVGSFDSPLFEKMVKRGDVASNSISNFINKKITIKGYSECTIETDDRKFTIFYFDTDEYGIISTGSEIFLNSVIDYLIDDIRNYRIVEIKTRKGKTYKAVPVLTIKEEQEELKEDLSF